MKLRLLLVSLLSVAVAADAARLVTTDWMDAPQNVNSGTFSNWFFNVYLSQKLPWSSVLDEVTTSASPVSSRAVKNALAQKADKATTMPAMTTRCEELPDSAPWEASYELDDNETLCILAADGGPGSSLSIVLVGEGRYPSRVIVHKMDGDSEFSFSAMYQGGGSLEYSFNTSGADVVIDVTPFETYYDGDAVLVTRGNTY